MSTAKITYTKVTLEDDGTVTYTEVHETEMDLCRVRNGGSMIHFNGGASTIYHWGSHWDSKFTGEYYIRNIVKITEEE
jgi:hypothetical protein